MIASLKAQNHNPDPPAWAAAAAIATSPQRRPRLPQKLPSDILTLQSKGHLNLVATKKNRKWDVLNQRPFLEEEWKTSAQPQYFAF